MIAARFPGLIPWLHFAIAAGAGVLGYVLLAMSIAPESPHWAPGIVIGLTLGVHTYRRARQRMARGGR